jgi:malonyl-CoA O-methyltransferase
MTEPAALLDPRQAYDLLAEGYERHPNPLVTLESRVLPDVLPPLAGARVADIAAGTGRWAAYCASRGARAIAVDFSRAMLDRAPRPAILADARHIPLRDECSDVTLCTFAFGYVPECLPELRRITRVGGSIIVSDVHPDAFRRGWTRSFRCGSRVIQVAHQPYSIAQLRRPGLQRTALLEPRFDEPERAVFERAGKAPEFTAAAAHPAIFIARLLRTA